MVERLARSPRLANLLRYVGDKALNGESDQIREYNIATEVFGRSQTFDSSQDAIARVEAHRLRKKLKEFYDAEGKNRPVQIVLPPGTYVPVFLDHEPPPEEKPTPEPPLPLQQPASSRARRRYLMGACALVAGVGVFAMYDIQRGKAKPGSAPEQAMVMPVPAAFSSDAVRVLAGYSGQPRISASGEVWGADRYFQGGRPDHGAQSFVGRTHDPFLFQTCRSGEFSYEIPLKPGVYEVRLYFVETSYGPGLGGGENDRTFAVNINGQPAIESLDIESDAMGPKHRR